MNCGNGLPPHFQAITDLVNPDTLIAMITCYTYTFSHNQSVTGHPWYSGSALHRFSTGLVIDPAPRGMMHNEIHPDCPQPSIALQCRIVAKTPFICNQSASLYQLYYTFFFQPITFTPMLGLLTYYLYTKQIITSKGYMIVRPYLI